MKMLYVVVVVFYFVFLAAHFRASTFDPCFRYFVLDKLDRSINFSTKHLPTYPDICDDNINESMWYRFVVFPPSRIHEGCLPMQMCGTFFPVFLTGSHPTADNPGPKEVDVCGRDPEDCCGSWRSTIKVKYCPSHVTGGKDFFVYKLKIVRYCGMAYCAGEGIAKRHRDHYYDPLLDVYSDKFGMWCMECSGEICTPKSGTCRIGEECFHSGEISYKDDCFTCLPLRNATAWTVDDSCPHHTLSPFTTSEQHVTHVTGKKPSPPYPVYANTASSCFEIVGVIAICCFLIDHLICQN